MLASATDDPVSPSQLEWLLDRRPCFSVHRYGTSLNYDEPDLDKRNIEILSVIRNNFLNNKMNSLMRGNNSCGYLNISSPYSTPYDESIKDKHENRKKWLNPKGFISCVNKNSGYPYRY